MTYFGQGADVAPFPIPGAFVNSKYSVFTVAYVHLSCISLFTAWSSAQSVNCFLCDSDLLIICQEN